MSHHEQDIIGELVDRSRRAQKEYETYSQERVDEVVTAVAWAICNPDSAARLAKLEVEESGMGNVEDKTYKNANRVFGTIAQMRGAKSVGVIEVDEARGLTKIAKPKGVFAALTPSTNMATGTAQNALAILKGRNSVIFSPQPRTKRTGRETCLLIREAIAKVGGPEDIVLVIENPTRPLRDELMRRVDVVLATGGATLVKAAYSCGRPAIGVGPGNAVTIIDGTSDVQAAVQKIARGKVFDHASSCSSENSVVIQRDVYGEALEHLVGAGAYVVEAHEKDALQRLMWQDGKLNDRFIARPAALIARAAGLGAAAERASFLVVEESGSGPAYPFSGEKLSVILTAYRFDTFDEAIARVRSIIEYQGRGHSCGIHSGSEANIVKLALSIDVCRVLVNQIQSAGNSGNFDNGLAFTTTLGCGSWGGNSVDSNVTWEHCVNITQLARVIPSWRPSEEHVFGDYHRKYGR